MTNLGKWLAVLIFTLIVMLSTRAFMWMVGADEEIATAMTWFIAGATFQWARRETGL